MKIKIKTYLTSKKEEHFFNGKAIKNKNIITYKDNNIITKIKIEDTITIERKEEYTLILNLKKGIKLEGSYITKYGSVNIQTYTKELKKEKNSLKIIYDLFMNSEYIDTFTYYYEYSIDS